MATSGMSSWAWLSLRAERPLLFAWGLALPLLWLFRFSSSTEWRPGSQPHSRGQYVTAGEDLRHLPGQQTTGESSFSRSKMPVLC